MELVTLQFDTPQHFSAFRKILSDTSFEMSVVNLTISSKFTKDEIELAITKYGAKVADTR
jgi:hypothetical protein